MTQNGTNFIFDIFTQSTDTHTTRHATSTLLNTVYHPGNNCAVTTAVRDLDSELQTYQRYNNEIKKAKDPDSTLCFNIKQRYSSIRHYNK
jgi:hypothetical protein